LGLGQTVSWSLNLDEASDALGIVPHNEVRYATGSVSVLLGEHAADDRESTTAETLDNLLELLAAKVPAETDSPCTSRSLSRICLAQHLDGRGCLLHSLETLFDQVAAGARERVLTQV
jgi:hypothetical protein